MEIDVRRGMLSLVPRGASSSESFSWVGAVWANAGATVTPGKSIQQHMAVGVRVGGGSHQMLVDTGSEADILLPANIAQQELWTSVLKSDGEVPASNMDGVIMLTRWSLTAPLELGGRLFDNVSVVVVDDSKFPAAAGKFPVILGMGLLSRFDRLCFDFENARLGLAFDPSTEGISEN